jgi:hypothetical protein
MLLHRRTLFGIVGQTDDRSNRKWLGAKGLGLWKVADIGPENAHFYDTNTE